VVVAVVAVVEAVFNKQNYVVHFLDVESTNLRTAWGKM